MPRGGPGRGGEGGGDDHRNPIKRNKSRVRDSLGEGGRVCRISFATGNRTFAHDLARIDKSFSFTSSLTLIGQ